MRLAEQQCKRKDQERNGKEGKGKEGKGRERKGKSREEVGQEGEGGFVDTIRREAVRIEVVHYML